MHHESFKSTDDEDEDVYALPRWFKITEEAPSKQLCAESSYTEVTNPINNGDVNIEQEVEALSIVNMVNERVRKEIMKYTTIAKLRGFKPEL